MTVGERIKARRLELGLSQAELADKLGYTNKSSVGKAENCGDNITTSKVNKYAKALNCSFEYLMGWEDDMPDTDVAAELLLKYPDVFDDSEFLLMYAKMSKDDRNKVKEFAKFVQSLH